MLYENEKRIVGDNMKNWIAMAEVRQCAVLWLRFCGLF